MSIAELKSEMDRLTPEERKQLTAYLVTKNRPLSPEARLKLTQKIDDNDPAHWLTLEEFGKSLGLKK
jgi:hypothetical protein